MKLAARSKAMIALAFASGALSSPSPGLAQPDSPTSNSAPTTAPVPTSAPAPTESAIQHIIHCDQLSAQSRANSLLDLASASLYGRDRASIEASYLNIKNQALAPVPRDSRAGQRAESRFVDWALALSMAGGYRTDTNEPSADKPSPPKENLTLAKEALQQSLTQLDQCTDTFAKMHLYYIASKLFERLGDATGTEQCTAYLSSAIQACEKNSHGDQEPIRAAVSVLTLMAIEIIPVYIVHQYDYSLRPKNFAIEPFTEKEFRESEKLRLRAVAMADKLPPRNHIRRKAHRDLSLWYSKLEKPELAEKEKQILFELVGIKDDALLQPASGICGGSAIWWQCKSPVFMGACGMG